MQSAFQTKPPRNAWARVQSTGSRGIARASLQSLALLTVADLATATCSNPADEKGKFDELVEEKGVRILIEPTAVMHLLGTRMNYVEDKLK